MTNSAHEPDTAASDGGPTDMPRVEILRGVLSPGRRLVEVALADRYGVGNSEGSL